MTKQRTPLHTRPERIEEYARLARDTLASVEADVDRLLESNRRELDAWPSSEVRDEELTERLELASWVKHTAQELTDLLYLLAVGDNGPATAAGCDPQGSSKQAHYERRRSALDRLEEQGKLA